MTEENDVELNVGVNFKTDSFKNAYDAFLRDISKNTQLRLEAAMDSLKGAAASSWDTLPYDKMHTSAGNKIASQAFLSSLGPDLVKSGYEKGSLEYESAMLNAVHRSSMSDPMQRHYRLIAEGLARQADLTHPGTALGKAIDTDYQLMSQPWSRNFVHMERKDGRKNGKLIPTIDFEGMREYAVKEGLGRWIDEDAGNTAENFKLTNDKLEDITDSFKDAYDAFLNDVSKNTQLRLKTVMDSLKGAAASSWGTLPYDEMHTNAGNKIASQAFLSSLGPDLEKSGYKKGSLEYESAMLNAVRRSSMADPMQRYHRMLAEGLVQQADLTHPDTALGKAINTDYELMSQPWSRDFIRKKRKNGKLLSTIDFEGMREYAVQSGLGRWIDEDAGNTAENFELINDELEDIEDKSDKSGKVFRGWGDTLKGVLGTLTAIGSIAGLAKTFEVAYKAAESGTVSAATNLDRRRALIGMSATDVLETQNAGQSIGLGKDTVYNEVLGMAENIQAYKKLGEGDALPASLLHIFDSLMTSDNPYETYKASLDELYNSLKGANTETQTTALMYMNKAGLGAGSSLIGAFLSNPALAAQYGNPSELFKTIANPYYDVYSKAETMLPELTQLNTSLKTSYAKLAEDWEEAFGKPFKTWWDNTLKNTVIPGFEAIIYMFSDAGKAEKAYDEALDAWDKKEDKLNKKTKWINVDVTADQLAALDNSRKFLTKEGKKKAGFIGWDYTGRNMIGDFTAGESFLKTVDAMADLDNYQTRTKDAMELRWRAELLGSFYKTTGFGKELGDKKATRADEELIQLGQKYMATGDTALLDQYLSKTYMQTEGWKELLTLIEEYRTYLQEHDDARRELHIRLFNDWGKEIHAEIDKAIGARAD